MTSPKNPIPAEVLDKVTIALTEAKKLMPNFAFFENSVRVQGLCDEALALLASVKESPATDAETDRWLNENSDEVIRARKLGFNVKIGRHKSLWFEDDKGQLLGSAFWSQRELVFYLNGWEDALFKSAQPKVVTVEEMMEYFDPDEHEGIENYLNGWAKDYPSGLKIVRGGA